jgi:cytochrome c oxidase cbb3-type subunit 1
MSEPWEHEKEIVYRKYTLWFIYACIIYSLIGFSWGAIMGGYSEFRHFVDHRLHGNLIVRGHTHINLLGWVEMAIFAAVYYVVPRLIKRPIYSLTLVKAHFWVHNVGVIGMVVFFAIAGTMGGIASATSSPAEVELIVKPLLAIMGIFGTLVLLANCIWAFNLFKTCAGWEKDYEKR